MSANCFLAASDATEVMVLASSISIWFVSLTSSRPRANSPLSRMNSSRCAGGAVRSGSGLVAVQAGAHAGKPGGADKRFTAVFLHRRHTATIYP